MAHRNGIPYITYVFIVSGIVFANSFNAKQNPALLSKIVTNEIVERLFGEVT